MSDLHLPLSIVLGVGLAAATGFRVFLPMLIVGVAAHTGRLPLDSSFAWLATPSALTMLSVALRAPDALGVKVTEIVQLEAATRALVQVVVCAKSAGFAPVIVIPVMARVPAPDAFDTVTV